MAEVCDVVVIGGGQAGLAAGYFLRRAGLDFAVLDAAPEPGGAWQHGWDSLRLFSPAEHSPLPGWPMPRQPGEEFPTAGHVVDYLARYEQRYDLPVHRPVRVHGVHRGENDLAAHTDHGTWHARAVISATGTWQSPYVPSYPGQEKFTGHQLHTVSYRRPDDFRGQRVIVVGGGNSAAQILAEVSTVAETTWVTSRRPRFMPEGVDGRVLFDVATRREAARRLGTEDTGGVAALGDIVMVPGVLEARDRGVLHAEPMFTRLTAGGVAWTDGSERIADAIIWCTGFRPSLRHLRPLALRRHGGIIPTDGTRSIQEPRLYLLGYGDWTGPASATLIGAGRTAKTTVADIAERLTVPVSARRRP
ncbi:cation diffusion facilitator CzcD-associated flavoprotein CzcO [Halopolyspora algeriensis]|uniref:Cation diffusion facilitator CzcD-associated flavoprotein CzcO n=1 Tax=Halopolyspora algeriensis TaxID=1500506 RepID=A0A368VES5_9ACTN|nr:ArsO family NAD(P)H-dependent flavin-containing monooxygenase [Halopolyspora algeriensis]RCW38770.1 cation diffusion facilitator CzcD-associated flavoprotein CzcO [Halopolyspora algeriensis]TQM55733.1 putative flavoprotein involved in K+ transport [Halopolyspora algeriensis]